MRMHEWTNEHVLLRFWFFFFWILKYEGIVYSIQNPQVLITPLKFDGSLEQADQEGWLREADNNRRFMGSATKTGATRGHSGKAGEIKGDKKWRMVLQDFGKVTNCPSLTYYWSWTCNKAYQQHIRVNLKTRNPWVDFCYRRQRLCDTLTPPWGPYTTGVSTNLRYTLACPQYTISFCVTCP